MAPVERSTLPTADRRVAFNANGGRLVGVRKKEGEPGVVHAHGVLGDGGPVQLAAAGVEGEGAVGFGTHVAADLVGEDVAGAFVAFASDLGDFAAALNLKTAVEPRLDPNGPGSQTDGSSERLTHEVKPVPRLYPG